ncbi:hypothetical protein MSPP1_000926 [Malassezia sp. CBS 17886]|nr:hypothetical protein MSPP1_000926 [Malassezia sp. CBS 17886]
MVPAYRAGTLGMLQCAQRCARGAWGRGAARRLLSAAAAGAQLAHLPQRALISLAGRDTINWLQGNISKDVHRLETSGPGDDAFYAGFFNPQGRVLADAFLHPVPDAPDTVLVEVDRAIAADLLKFMRRFKLRSKFVLADVSDAWDVYHLWGAGAKDAPHDVNATGQIARRDARCPAMGWRILVRKGEKVDVRMDSQPATEHAYTLHRMLNGVPEGAREIKFGTSLPLESCMDYMHGIDFRKGCYIGQELTARTHFTGLVRKRIVPVVLRSEGDAGAPAELDESSALSLPNDGEDVRLVTSPAAGAFQEPRPARTRSAGRFLSGIDNVGLGLLRLEQVTKVAAAHAGGEPVPYLAVAGANGESLRVHASTPAWWPREEEEGVPGSSCRGTASRASMAAHDDEAAAAGALPTWQTVEGVVDPNTAGTHAAQEKTPAPQPAPDGLTDEEHQHQRYMQDIFNIVHARSSNAGEARAHLQQHGFDLPTTLSHLWKRPVVRQWIHAGYVFREKSERLPSRFELFFDLVFVGIAHIVADGAAQESSGVNVLKFVMEYFPTWSVWMDASTFLNTSGTDDVKERIGLLIVMILLVGYSANAAALQIVSAGRPHAAGAARLHELCPAGAAAGSSDCRLHVLGAYIGSGYWFLDGYLQLFHSAVAFYLVLRLFRTLLYVYYGLMLPKFRVAMWMNAAVHVAVSCIYVPIMFQFSAALIVTLMFVGMGAEILSSSLVVLLLRVYSSTVVRKKGTHLYIPALSQEHAMERTVQFVIVVVGEVIINSTYRASERTFGLSGEFGRAALSVVCAFMLIWMYYDADSCRTFQHASRRNALTSLSFSLLHFPLTASLILGGAALSQLIKVAAESGGYLWYWSGSVSTALACIGALGALHRNLDLHGSTALPRWVRLLLRFVVAAVILFVPLMRDEWDTLSFLGVNAGILAALVIIETLTKIGAVGRRYDANASRLVHRAKRTRQAMHDACSKADAVAARRKLADMNALHPRQAAGLERAHENPLEHLRLARSLSWHPYVGLSLAEKGEEDVGMEGELGQLEMKESTAGQRWAFVV